MLLEETLHAGSLDVGRESTLRIALRLFDTLERNRFLSLFKIIQLESAVVFSLVDCERANVVIIDPDEPGGEQMLQAPAGEITAVAYTDSHSANYRHAIQKPVKIKPLLSMLQMIAENSVDATEEIEAEPESSDASVGVIDPDVGLLGLLRKKGGEAYYRITTKGNEAILLDCANGCYYSALGDPKHVATVIGDTITNDQENREVVLDAAEFRQAVEGDTLQPYPVASLLWSLLLFHRGAARIRGLDATRPLQLKQWPNLTKLPHRPEHARLCALFVQHPSTIEMAAARAGMSTEVVSAFINACASQNLVRYAQEAPDEPQRESGETARSDLLTKIVKRLFG